MFIDQVKIFLKAGRGGNGCVSFRREKYVPRGGPDGGPGGSGGSIYLKATQRLNTLNRFFVKKHFSAPDGKAGGSKNKNGATGRDLYIEVPIGTIVKDLSGNILSDLSQEGAVFLAARGGRGGRGNKSFVSSVNQAPRERELGEPGEEKVYILELSVLADVGLVGQPNAGKSTFLSVISQAKPKVASYPFTTLEPVLGYVNIDGEGDFVVADIPGLIEGAHSGKGLGIRFLQHILRVRVLLFLIDITDIDPIKTYQILQAELDSFSPHLQKKKRIIAFTKVDLLDEDEEYIKQIGAEFLNKFGDKFSQEDVFFISSVTFQGVKPLLYHLSKVLSEIPKDYSLPRETISDDEYRVFRLEDEVEEIKIEQIDKKVWQISHKEIERLAYMTDFENEESFYKFLREMEKRGVESLLREKGVSEGDTVIIGGKEFLWIE